MSWFTRNFRNSFYAELKRYPVLQAQPVDKSGERVKI